MKRSILVAGAAASLVAGGLWWTTCRGSQSDPPPGSTTGSQHGPGRAALDAADRSTPRRGTTASPTDEQEQRELAFIAEVAGELELDATQTAEVNASYTQMQAGRRELFDGLAAGRETAEQVSEGLGQLRSSMYARIEAAIGNEKTARLRERMRAEHGYEPAPPPQ